MGLIDQHLNAPVPRLSRRIPWIPYAFDSILAKAMAKGAERRYGSCAEMIRLMARTLR
jgi:serine/threonine-protein kinase